ncbi:hypothetical protein [Dyella mobilis]|uniref:DUF4041 domain-containing protein n=1 Tax=Dyella mobilis TaxID=1849582 RepID=A0ABS2KJQ1_9GAMM|nr:hypothetical protein [Dyella mobilis]MBM7131270.1 hypothetical protein [Dyella mobilis]GLQ98794.1 hypothetical protein GCM10007863_32140 [Dyella mobilis]
MVSWLSNILGSAATAIFLIGILVWLCRKWIGERLTTSIKAEYDVKLAQLNSDLRKAEDELKATQADLSASTAAVREASLAARSHRSACLYEKKLLAVDNVWDAARVLREAGAVCAFVWRLKFDEAAREAERSAQFRRVFEVFDYDTTELNRHNASSAQPYISSDAWKCFEAIRVITMHGVTRWIVLKTGCSENELVSVEKVIQTVGEMFPDLKGYMEQYETAGFVQVITELQARLLNQLRAEVSGNHEDHDTVTRAAAIAVDVEMVLEKTRMPSLSDVDAGMVLQVPVTAPPIGIAL